MKVRCATPEAYKLLHQGSLALARVEAAGMRIDTDYLEKERKRITAQVTALEDQMREDDVFRMWKARFGPDANLGSRPQLGDVLFKDLGLKVAGLTATGRFRTDKAVLAKIDHPFVRMYDKVRKLKDIRDKFLEGIRREVVDGFLHPVFNLHTAVTYRSSAALPNSQNFPARDAEMTESVRKCFIARPGNQILEIDFKGIEVAIATTYHKDPTMIRYLEDTKNSDMHRDEAAGLFCLDTEFLIKYKDWAKKKVRDWAKNRWVFPQFYGSVYFQCAPHLWQAVADESNKMPDGTTVRDHLASKGIESLGRCDPRASSIPGTFEHHCKEREKYLWGTRFKVYAEWKRRFWAEYQKKGGFLTNTGFYVSWGKGGPLTRNDATNYGTQGSAFHCLLWVLIQVEKWLRKNKMKSMLIGQIHDSMLFDCDPQEMPVIIAKVRQLVEVELIRHWPWINVPMAVEAEAAPVGGSWYDKKEVH